MTVIAYLGEAERVKLILGGDLEAAGLAVLDVVGGLCADLDGTVDLLVVAGGDDGQILAADDGGAVARGLIAETEGVAGDGGLLDVVACLTADQETLVAGNEIDDSVDVVVGHAMVDEDARMDHGVLVGDGELLGGRVGLARVPQVLDVNLGAGGDEIGKLDLGIEQRGGGPGLGDGDACRVEDR